MQHPAMAVPSWPMLDAQQTLLQQSQLLQMALDEGELGSWTHDLEQNALACSAKCREQFGLPESGPITIDMVVDRVEPSGRAAYMAHRLEALKRQGGHRIEVRVIDRLGQSRTLQLHFYVHHRTPLRPLVSGVTVDITKRRMVEASASEAQAMVNTLVKERTRMLADLNVHTIATIEGERKALARELHDEMGSLLTLMSFEISKLKEQIGQAPQVQKAVTQLGEQIEALRQYKHRVIAGLRPPLLQELGLAMALRDHAESFARSRQLQLKLHIEDPLPALKEDAALALFRVLQESLTNVGKYAQARTVDIDVLSDGTDLTMTICDDGIGLPVVMGPCKQFGLLGIRERIQALGGTASFTRIKSSGGTCVHVTLPLLEHLEAGAP